MISLSIGVAIGPRLPADEKLVRYVPLDDPLRMRDVYISWAKGRALPPAVEYVRDYCIGYFNGRKR